MTPDCIFCRIAAGEIPARKVYEDESFFAFHDISPQAPVHILLIPKAHIPALDDLSAANAPLMGDLLLKAVAIARDQGLSESGYRIVANCREGAGQSVFHIHFHILGGRPMGWPPG